jgi:WD40 repeat protein
MSVLRTSLGPALTLAFFVIAPHGGGRAEGPRDRREGRTARTDLYGDPLPPGALARLGTVRLRGQFNLTNLSFSPDSRLLASTNFFTGRTTLFLWERETGRMLHKLGGRRPDDDDAFSHYVFTPDSKGVISADSQGEQIVFWDVASGEERRRLKGPGAKVTALAISPDGRLLAYSNSTYVVRLWDLVAGQIRRTVASCRISPDLAFTPDGKRLAILDSATVRLVDLATGETRHRFTIRGSCMDELAPDGRTVATCNVRDGLLLWDVATGTKRRLAPRDPEGPCKMSFSPDGKTLLAADWKNGTVLFADVNGGPVRRLRVSGMIPERDMLLSPDGRTLAASANHWSELRLWDATTGKRLLDYPGHTSSPRLLIFSPDGTTLVSHRFDEGILRWDVRSGRLLSQARTPQEVPFPDWHDLLVFSPTADVAARTEGLGIDLYDTRTGRVIRRLRGHTKDLVSLAFSPEGRTLASGSLDGTLRLWDVATGETMRVIDTRRQAKKINWIHFTPDGQTLATGDGVLRIHLWRADTGAYLARMDGDAERWKDVAVDEQHWDCCFAPDGRTLFVSNLGNLYVWDVPGRREARPFEPEDPTLLVDSDSIAVTVSPDGRLLAWVGVSGGLCLWETASRKMVIYFTEGHSSIAFAPDGRTLATGCCENGSILVWDLKELFGGAGPRTALHADEPARLWRELADADAPRAYRTVGRLMSDEETALAVFTKFLTPAQAATPEELAALVKQLDSPVFAERQRATARLEELQGAAEPVLERLRRERVSLEMRRRAEAILEGLRPDAPVSLRQVRGVHVLEYLGTPAARRLLGRLAEGAPEARLTQEAKAALRCLSRRPPAP